MFSFVHCADLHLGIMPEKSVTRFNDFFEVFKSCINDAVSKKVDFIIVAGDMFHQKVINPKTLLKTSEILKIAKDNDIDVLVIEGNHDRAFYIDEVSWLTYLKNEGLIKLLSIRNSENKFTLDNIYEKDEYRVIGVEYLGGATEKYIPEIHDLLPKDNKVNVLIMHAAIDRMVDQNMGDVSGDNISILKDKCIYLALGHVHSKYIYGDFVFNPGSLENLRTKDELSGEKGYFYVQIDASANRRDVEYISSSRRPIRYKVLDCADAKTPDEVIDRLKEFTNTWEDVKDGSIIYLGIKGKTLFNPLLIDNDLIKQIINDKFNVLYIEIYANFNDMGSADIESDGINVEAIVEDAIESEIKYMYPDVKNPEKLASLMNEIGKKISDEMIEKDIFDLLAREEDL